MLLSGILARIRGGEALDLAHDETFFAEKNKRFLNESRISRKSCQKFFRLVPMALDGLLLVLGGILPGCAKINCHVAHKIIF